MSNHHFVFLFFCLCAALGCGRKNPSADRLQATEERLDKLESRMAAVEASATNQDALRVTRMPLVENSTGNELCAEKSLVCLNVYFEGGSLLSDRNGKSCGYAVADCNTRVVPYKHCLRESDYMAVPIKYWKSPSMTGQCGHQVSNQTCLDAPEFLVAMCIAK